MTLTEAYEALLKMPQLKGGIGAHELLGGVDPEFRYRDSADETTRGCGAVSRKELPPLTLWVRKGPADSLTLLKMKND